MLNLIFDSAAMYITSHQAGINMLPIDAMRAAITARLSK